MVMAMRAINSSDVDNEDDHDDVVDNGHAHYRSSDGGRDASHDESADRVGGRWSRRST